MFVFVLDELVAVLDLIWGFGLHISNSRGPPGVETYVRWMCGGRGLSGLGWLVQVRVRWVRIGSRRNIIWTILMM